VVLWVQAGLVLQHRVPACALGGAQARLHQETSLLRLLEELVPKKIAQKVVDLAGVK
jgi:hypothetical protein